jgi:hypothetical protein
MSILVHFMFIWYIFTGFGIMCQEKSGNPGTYVQITKRKQRNHACMVAMAVYGSRKNEEQLALNFSSQ